MTPVHSEKLVRLVLVLRASTVRRIEAESAARKITPAQLITRLIEPNVKAVALASWIRGGLQLQGIGRPSHSTSWREYLRQALWPLFKSRGITWPDLLLMMFAFAIVLAFVFALSRGAVFCVKGDGP